jgi:hypothetical protein
MEFRDSRVDLFEADGFRIPHRAAAMSGEGVAIQINNVGVRGAQGVALPQDARAFVDQGIDATVGDFRGGDLSLRNARFLDPLSNKFIHLGIWHRAALLITFVPARSCFLPVSPEFTKPVFEERLTNARRFQMTMFFPHSPAHIEPRKVAGRQRSHGHSEVAECLVDGNPRTFFDEELRLTAVRTKHAIADKTPAVANQHAHLAFF